MNYKHGACVKKRTRIPATYRAWASMIARCYCPSSVNYKRYGGRGIQVCGRWRIDYLHFLQDMGPKPHPKASLDRKNNNGDYTPENCRWATPRQQAENRKGTIWVLYKGQTRSLKDWARVLNVNYYSLRDRYNSGWTTKRMIETPLKSKFYER